MVLRLFMPNNPTRPNLSGVKVFTAAAGLLFFGLVTFHLGPTLGLGKPDRVRAALGLRDGSRLILLQTRNSDIIDAYTVNLFRLFKDGAAEVCLVGYEESYWWWPSMRQAPDGALVEIRADGSAACIYDSVSRQLTWNDKKYPLRSARPATDEPQLRRLRLLLRD